VYHVHTLCLCLRTILHSEILILVALPRRVRFVLTLTGVVTVSCRRETTIYILHLPDGASRRQQIVNE